jgi:hypothetical protein
MTSQSRDPQAPLARLVRGLQIRWHPHLMQGAIPMRLPFPRTVVLLGLVAACSLLAAPVSRAQTVLFDFSNAPVYSPFPIDVTVSGITAHFSGTGSGYSIQSTSTSPVVPAGFSNNFIYPSSVFPADLLVSFSQTLSHFSIMYAPDELGCDDSCTMSVTAWLNGGLVGTNTSTISNPNGASYPVGTLSCAFPQGFNSVVVHWVKKGQTCQDYGPIFLADNMLVTAEWGDLGFAKAGTQGLPHLTGSGPLSAGSTNQLSLSNARHVAPATLVIGSTAINAPFKGGVMVPDPMLLVPLVTSAVGGVVLPAVMPPGVPVGTTIDCQFWIQDSGATKGFAASNAVMGIAG